MFVGFIEVKIPTLYQPNFCAECGAAVEPRRWRFWRSRSFCLMCAKEFQPAQVILPLLMGVALFAGGFLIEHARRPATPPLIIERKEVVAANGSAQNISQSANDRSAATVAEQPTDSQEKVSICGARTKRGTPCSRKVRGTGRCWQHPGKSAMLPASKLIVAS